MTVAEQVDSVTAGVGVVLVLIALFTSEQARRNDTERTREGGARGAVVSTTVKIAVGLVVITALTFAALAPLAVQILDTCCGGSWNASQAVFLLLWVLLVPLAIWQVFIARESRRLSPPRS